MLFTAATMMVMVQAATLEEAAPDPINQQIHWGRRIEHLERPLTAADIDTVPMRRLGRRRIVELLRGSRMHDPDCPTHDGCEEIFLLGGRYSRSVSFLAWEHGTYIVRRNSYCTRINRSKRCYELWERPGGPWVRVPIRDRRSSGRIVNLVPATR